FASRNRGPTIGAHPCRAGEPLLRQPPVGSGGGGEGPFPCAPLPLPQPDCYPPHMPALDKAVARLFCVGFHGTSVPPEMKELIRRGVGGAILFSRNVEAAPQVADLCRSLKEEAGRPFLTSIDQEGGRVMRLREGFSPVPPMRA